MIFAEMTKHYWRHHCLARFTKRIKCYQLEQKLHSKTGMLPCWKSIKRLDLAIVMALGRTRDIEIGWIQACCCANKQTVSFSPTEANIRNHFWNVNFT